MTPTTTKFQVHVFIGLVKCYRDMWSIRLHLLQPLTALKLDKVTFKCTAVEQKSFEDIKNIVLYNTLLGYIYFDE